MRHTRASAQVLRILALRGGSACQDNVNDILVLPVTIDPRRTAGPSASVAGGRSTVDGDGVDSDSRHQKRTHTHEGKLRPVVEVRRHQQHPIARIVCNQATPLPQEISLPILRLSHRIPYSLKDFDRQPGVRRTTLQGNFALTALFLGSPGAFAALLPLLLLFSQPPPP